MKMDGDPFCLQGIDEITNRLLTILPYLLFLKCGSRCEVM